MKRLIVGITGASGSVYAKRLIECLLGSGHQVHLVMTDAGIEVANYELGWTLTGDLETDRPFLAGVFGGDDRLTVYSNRQIGATLASGSFRTDGMIIIPASMGAVSGIACGRSDNLLERTADVVLKERRPLILMPRETPLSPIHLENLLKLSRLGVDIIPAMPAFYNRPRTIDDMVDFLVGRVLDHLNIEHELFERWKGESAL